MAAGAAEIDDSAAVRVAAAVRFLIHQVEIVDDVLAGQNSRRCGPRPEPSRIARTELGKGGRYAAHRHTLKVLSVKYVEDPEGTAAQAQCLLEHHIEHGTEITRRRIDDLQYLSGRGLLLQSLARLGQEPRVLHCDDRLRSEVLQQRNFPLGERADFLAIDMDGAKECLVLAQRHCNKTTGSGDADQRLEAGSEADNLGFGQIGYRDQALATDYAFEETSGRERARNAWDRGQVLRREPARCDAVKALVVPSIHAAEARVAHLERLFQYRVEHRREIAGRGVDDLQYFGGGGLLL